MFFPSYNISNLNTVHTSPTSTQLRVRTQSDASLPPCSCSTLSVHQPWTRKRVSAPVHWRKEETTQLLKHRTTSTNSYHYHIIEKYNFDLVVYVLLVYFIRYCRFKLFILTAQSEVRQTGLSTRGDGGYKTLRYSNCFFSYRNKRVDWSPSRY